MIETRCCVVYETFGLFCPTRDTHGQGEHVVWILDFDLDSDMTIDQGGVEQAVKAF